MIGPSNPYAKGQLEALSPYLLRQEYPDGWVYQIKLRRGSAFQTMTAQTQKIPAEHLKRAVWFRTYDPIEWEDDDDSIYMSLWVANSNG